LFARKIQNKIGDTGITVIGKIMGLILASFAVQNILTGIKDYFKWKFRYFKSLFSFLFNNLLFRYFTSSNFSEVFN